jgi:acyl carrier protein
MRDEIFEKVQEVLVDALGVEEEDVTLTALLKGDLGAESIDILDVSFRLERKFLIKIPRNELLLNENVGKDGDYTVGAIVDYIRYKLAIKDKK